MTTQQTSLLLRGDIERERDHQQLRLTAALDTIGTWSARPDHDWWVLEEAIGDVREASAILRTLDRIVPVDPF